MNNLNRAVQMSPYAATDKYGEVLDLHNTLELLKQDVQLFTDLAEWEITEENLNSLNDLSPTLAPSAAADKLKIDVDDEYKKGTSGLSRVRRLVGAKAVEELRSWNERIKALEDKTDKYVSQGWQRTVRGARPRNLKPKINLAHADGQYSKVEIVDNEVLILSIVIQGQWRKLYFNYDIRLRNCDKVTLPAIHINKDGKLVFTFVAQYKPLYPYFNSDYVIGVDVGIANYATVAVVDVKTKRPVYTTTLFRRVHSLANKVRKANKQVASLQRKGRHEEAALHRQANKNRKRELAITAAQEIAELSFNWGNALVAFEDLSWITNTMQNGRWNRGELYRRTEEMVELNGGRVLKVNARNTSQLCCICGRKLVFDTYHTVLCSCGVVADRDENAAVNIGLRLLEKGRFKKCCNTRNGNKKKGKANANANKKKKQQKKDRRLIKRSRGGAKNLKYPGRDRTKNRPTPKKPKMKNMSLKKEKEVKELINTRCSAHSNDDYTSVALDGVQLSEVVPMTVTGSTTTVNNCPRCRIL